MKSRFIGLYPRPVLELEAGNGSFFVAHVSGQVPSTVELYLTVEDLRALFETLKDHRLNREREMQE